MAIEDAWKRLLNTLDSRRDSAGVEAEGRRGRDQRVSRQSGKLLYWLRWSGSWRCWESTRGFELWKPQKIAVVDETGKFLTHDVIYPFQTEDRRRRAR